MLCSPDVLYRAAFQLFDTRGSGLISFGKLIIILFLKQIFTQKNTFFFFQENFKEIIGHTVISKEMPFNFECDFITNNFGKNRDKQINYQEFTQIIHVKKI
jgi:solute carrier family 25 aspartate/glutamate transporter 12/13